VSVDPERVPPHHRALRWHPHFDCRPDKIKYEEHAQDPKAEANLFSTALTEAARQLDKLKANLQSRAPNEAAILHAQKQLLQDELVLTDSEKFIEMARRQHGLFIKPLKSRLGH
jgi:phosphoenolpyruvate-protein kinase (PTS system EI component)